MSVDIEISPSLIARAHEFAELRARMKRILRDNDMEFDKFTVTERDSFDGFIAEASFTEFLKDNIGLREDEIARWGKDHPIDGKTLEKIIIYPAEKKFSSSELSMIRDHFYDKWDLLIRRVRIDVKTAATHLQPTGRWTYGVSKIQMEKGNKDFIVLNYLIYDKDPKANADATPIKCVLVGCLSIDYVIKNCPVVRKNKAAGHKYFIENYETKVSEYMDVSEMF